MYHHVAATMSMECCQLTNKKHKESNSCNERDGSIGGGKRHRNGSFSIANNSVRVDYRPWWELAPLDSTWQSGPLQSTLSNSLTSASLAATLPIMNPALAAILGQPILTQPIISPLLAMSVNSLYQQPLVLPQILSPLGPTVTPLSVPLQFPADVISANSLYRSMPIQHLTCQQQQIMAELIRQEEDNEPWTSTSGPIAVHLLSSSCDGAHSITDQNNCDPDKEAAELLLSLGSRLQTRSPFHVPENHNSYFDAIVRYPLLFQQCHNTCDVNEFIRVFLNKCDEKVVVMGHYVDAQQRPIHRNALRFFIGRPEFESYLHGMFQTIPDACFSVKEVTLLRRKQEFMIRSRFVYYGTSLQFKQRQLKQKEDIDNKKKKDEPLIRSVPSIFRHDNPIPPDHYKWIPVESSPPEESAEKDTYILGQFIPSRVKELVVDEDSVLEAARAAEVGLDGTLTLYINSVTRLIRRMDFSYQQVPASELMG